MNEAAKLRVAPPGDSRHLHHTRRPRSDWSSEAAQVLGRMGTIEEAEKLWLFIAAEATFTTGVDHIISGGAELGYGRKSRVGPK